MPTALNDGARDGVPTSYFLRAARRLRLSFAILSLGGGMVCFAPPAAWAKTAAISRALQKTAAKVASTPSPKRFNQKKWGKLEGYAMWYSVPVNSLAKRRAGKDEFTAAHNRLPLGTKVRVTHLANGKSVIVRITDRGITDRRALIDLCKEAATELDMIREGATRVRLEILPDDQQTSAPPESNSTASHP